LYLTIGLQTNSFAAPFLARGAGLVNFSGGYAPLGPEGVNGVRMAALISRYAPHVRVLVPSANLYGGDALRSEVDIALERFGLRVDTRDCSSIIVHGLPPDLQATPTSQTSTAVDQARYTTNLVSCHLVTDGVADPARYATDRQTADLVLDRLEDACPELFQPRSPLTEPGAGGWVRRYANTDLTAWVSRGRVKFTQLVGDDRVVFVGRESDWAKAPLRLACGRRNGEYFATVLASKAGP
jgi:hypothetical protein